MNQQIKTWLGTAVLIIIAITVGTFVWIRYDQNPIADYNTGQQVYPPKLIDRNDQIKACTQEAKLCSDGSAVGRTGPNCEFSPCPDVAQQGVVYRNEKYGFQLILPEIWSTYSVKEGKDGMGYSFVDITVPDNSKPANMISMMSIMFYDKKTWKPNDNDLIGMKVGENANYYFYYTPGLQDDIPGTEGMREAADNVMKTLKAL